MQNVQEVRAIPKIASLSPNPGLTINFYTYAIGTLLILASVTGWQILRATTRVRMTAKPVQSVTSAPAVIPRSPVIIEASAATLHSTLSVDVFFKYVSRNSQRMYPRLSREIVQAAVKYSEKYDLSPVLVLAVAATESEFYPFALSKKNAKGLMQINPEANQDLLTREGIFKEPSDIFDPDRNIEAGCFLLRRFINQSRDLDSALDNYLGADSVSYKAEIHRVMGKVLLLGITEEINRTTHKIQPIVKVETTPKSSQ